MSEYNTAKTVNVNVRKQGSATSRASFDTGLFLSYEMHSVSGKRVETFISPQSMADAGFDTNGETYQWAVQFFGQFVKPEKILIGYQLGEATITLVLGNETLYKFVVNGTTVSYTSDVDATAAEVSAGVQAAIDAVAGVDAVDASPDVTVSATGTDPFALQVHSDSAAVASITWAADASESAETAIGLVRTVNATWTALAVQASDSVTHTPIMSLTRITDRYITYLRSRDTTVRDSFDTTPYKTEADLINDRVHLSYTDIATNYPDAVAMSIMLTRDPGEINLNMSRVRSILPDTFTDTQYAELDSNRISYIDTVGGTNVAIGGKMLGGEWLHIQRNIDWLIVTSTLQCLNVFIQNDIVGHDQNGYAIFIDVLEVTGDTAEGQGVLVSGTSGAQLTAEPTAEDRVAQELNNLELFGQVRYAINTIDLTIRLSV